MTDAQQRKAAKEFAAFWKDKGYEKGESQAFWLSLLRDVYGVEHPEQFVSFEDQVHLDHTSFIDAMIPSTKVMIEQKGLGKDLNKAIRQSDGTLLSPFQQAKRYITELLVSQHPRWVVTCNFSEFYVYDMERPRGEPEKILLADLEKEYYRLSFLVDEGNVHLKREMEVSIAAGEIVGLLNDAFLKQYVDPTSEETLKSLNVLCVRLVFCLYAEDAGIFGRREMFHDYLASFDTENMRKALVELFEVLDTKPEERDPYLIPKLAEFPYVNGGLFEDEKIEIPLFTDEIRDLLLNKASADFDWSEISPTIFGAVFESTLNPETRRSGGMHYTSIENIHKVIDPLFLDDLKKEFEEIKQIQVTRAKTNKLRDFQKKLASLTFLDPACGSGNFLTETYLSLRRLENDILRILSGGQISFATEEVTPIQVKINQFYGIEINDFAVTVAKTALWIAESQMLKETEDILLMRIDFLPLTTNASIVEGNALRLDWNEVVPKSELNYIMGNPPFVGSQYMSKEQKNEIMSIFDKSKRSGVLDYVSGWYYKSAEFMVGTEGSCAFVSTNSITQGEQVAVLWKPILAIGMQIDFAYRTFKWESESQKKAAVHCVIIGYSEGMGKKHKKLFLDSARPKIVSKINPYLIEAPDIIIESRKKPIDDVPEITKGCQPTDGGNLIIEAEDYYEFIKEEPGAIPYIKNLVGAREFINNLDRYCLWLVGISPTTLRSMPKVMERVERVKQMRLASTDKGTRRLAETPHLHFFVRHIIRIPLL